MEPEKTRRRKPQRPDVRARAAQIEQQLRSVPHPEDQPDMPYRQSPSAHSAGSWFDLDTQPPRPPRQTPPPRSAEKPRSDRAPVRSGGAVRSDGAVARSGSAVRSGGAARSEGAFARSGSTARSEGVSARPDGVPRSGNAPVHFNDAPARHAEAPVRFDSVPRHGAPEGPGDFELPEAPAMAPRVRPEAGRGTQRAGRRRRSMSSGMFFLLSAAFILTVSWGITALIEMPGKRAEAARLAAESAQTKTPAAPEGEIGPVKSANAAYTPISAAVVAQPENGRVDMKYFDDALFIGDSLTRGFEEYASGIPNAHYAAYIGAGPRQFMEGLVQNRAGEQVAAIDEILAAAPRKVYILLGTNALPALTDDAFLKYYGDLLDFLTPQLPADTVYYIQAIPPAIAEKMDGDENFSRERIQAINERLARLAFERGIAFLDLYSVLADDTGALRADIASGDIHLNNAGYSLWREFLVTHAVYRKDNPYLPGSPCYLESGA